MTEHQIFKLLTEDTPFEYDVDYPCLQKDTLNCISQNFTRIIYESLKQKSYSSNVNRGNVLRFINKLSSLKEPHINTVDNYPYRKLLAKYIKIEDDGVKTLLDEIQSELDCSNLGNVINKVTSFHQRKNNNRGRRNKLIELIRQKDQGKLESKFNLNVQKFISSYEVDENHIKQMLGDCDKKQNKDENMESRQPYREKQIKLIYALMNLDRPEDVEFIHKILEKLTKYDTLEECEINFVLYLWNSDFVPAPFKKIFTTHFFFVLERIILKLATKLLRLENEMEVCRLFVDLDNDQNVLRIRDICKQNVSFRYQLRSLIFELYSFSRCNSNVLKLLDVII